MITLDEQIEWASQQLSAAGLFGEDTRHWSAILATLRSLKAQQVPATIKPIGYSRKQDLLEYKPIVPMYSTEPEAENGHKAVRRSNEHDLARASSLGGAVGEFWGGDAFPYRVGQRHYEFVALSDERVPIPQRGKDG